MPYGTVQADVIGTSVTGSNIGAGNASLMKNRIINGAMVIDQRNAGASVTPTTNGQYTLDRWRAALTVTSKYSVQQNAGAVTPPDGFKNYLGITSLSAYTVVTSDAFLIGQFIEGYNVADLNWGTANAKPVTLSFWVRSSLTGTFGGSIKNNDSTRSYPFSYTVSVANTWEQKAITITGETTGTWLTTNGSGFIFNLGLGVGSTYSGTAGSWASADYRSATGATSVVGTSGATFYITGVQLEVGSSATGFEYRQYGQELALCQRYYQRYSGFISIFGYWDGSNAGLFNLNFPVTTRVAPTGITTSSVSNFTINNSGIGNPTANAITFGTASTSNLLLNASVASGGSSTGKAAYLGGNSSAFIDITGCEL